MSELSFGSKIGRCIVSAIISAFLGLLEAEVIANSLIEISFTKPFAIIFGIAFLLLGIVLGWRVWSTDAPKSRRIGMALFALLVFSSGFSAFFVEINWLDTLTSVQKVPLYSLLGISLSFSLTFSFTEFVNLGVCDGCCRTNFGEQPLIGSKLQIILIFCFSLLMGATYGILFGALDVENSSASKKGRFTELLIDSIPIGVIFGGSIGFANQWLRMRNDYERITSTPQSTYDESSQL